MDKLTTIISNTTTVDNGNCSIGRLAIEHHGEQRLFDKIVVPLLYFQNKKKEQSVEAMSDPPTSHPNGQSVSFPLNSFRNHISISYRRIGTLITH